MNAETERCLADLESSLARLAAAIDQPRTNPLWLDGAIQRFEFAFELCWRLMKRLLAVEGVDVRTPREALQRAFQAGWLDDEETWLTLLRARIASTRAYDEAGALGLCEIVVAALPQMQSVAQGLARRARGV